MARANPLVTTRPATKCSWWSDVSNPLILVGAIVDIYKGQIYINKPIIAPLNALPIIRHTGLVA